MDMEKVKSLGLPVGPILKELKNGKTVPQLRMGTVQIKWRISLARLTAKTAWADHQCSMPVKRTI